MQNKGPLTVFGKWENVEFSFPSIPIKPFPFPLPTRETIA